MVSLRELVSLRIRDCIHILQLSDLSDCSSITYPELIEKIKNRRSTIIDHITPLWKKRFKTSTAMYRTEKGDVQYIDVPTYAFRLPKHAFDDIGGTYHYRRINYSDVSDGGARVIGDIEGDIYGTVSWQEYYCSQGGNKTLYELDCHPVVQAILPDPVLRQKYLTCL